MDSFSLLKKQKLIFGQGMVKSLTDFLPENTQRIVLIIARSFLKSSTYDYLKELLDKQSIQTSSFVISGEPVVETVDSIVSEIQVQQDCVISIGGGSVLDVGKAVAAMLCHKGSVKDYLEGVGTQHPTANTIFFIAIPTTAGTGSEATKNAVISQPGPQGFKKSLRHDAYIPDVALIDPELMVSCPKHVTLACGMDAFSQLIESYISTNATPETDKMALVGLEAFSKSFPDVCLDKAEDVDARGQMGCAAYLSGVTLAEAGLATIHGIAGSLGGYTNIPHGVACGTLLPQVLEAYLKKLGTNHPVREKLNSIGKLLAERHQMNFQSGAETLLYFLKKWQKELKLPTLSQFQLDEDDCRNIAYLSDNKNAPVALSKEEIESILISRL